MWQRKKRPFQSVHIFRRQLLLFQTKYFYGLDDDVRGKQEEEEEEDATLAAAHAQSRETSPPTQKSQKEIRQLLDKSNR